MAKKMVVLALMVLVAGMVSAQQSSGGLQQHAATEVIGAKKVVHGPTYADVYCAGYIASPVPAALGHLVAGWDMPNQMQFGTNQFVYLKGSGFEVGKDYQVIRPGKDLTIVACGVEVARALDAAKLLEAKGIEARVVNMPTIKPIDAALLARCAEETGAFVTAEDHNIYGGLGGAVAEALAGAHPAPIEFVGVKDRFGESGEPEELAQKLGLGADSIAAAAEKVLKRKIAR